MEREGMKEMKAFVFGQTADELISHGWRFCNLSERAGPAVLVVSSGYVEGTTET